MTQIVVLQVISILTTSTMAQFQVLSGEAFPLSISFQILISGYKTRVSNSYREDLNALASA